MATAVVQQSEEPPRMLIETMGEGGEKLPVEVSTRFLQHFSEFMYSSPQKAFEELISNAWDAGARVVDVRIASDLESPTATLCVLDDGVSMNETGLAELWHIAFSPKVDQPVHLGRPVTGKFGIGKLATYVLSGRLTYICCAGDGVIRRVTMDYGQIDSQRADQKDRLVKDLEVQVFTASMADVELALADVQGGDELLAQIRHGMMPDAPSDADDEFGGPELPPVKPTGTWTLAVMSALKRPGRDLKMGRLRRMLSAALPFGTGLTIRVNGETLASSKVDAGVEREWSVGPALGIRSVRQTMTGDPVDEDDPQSGGLGVTDTPIVTGTGARGPYVELPGIGRVTGTMTLFKEKISGGKSDALGISNGFHVNVLGRVVNLTDPLFGGRSLSHASWARFRLAVRADGLNEYITTSREQFLDTPEVRLFRAFLQAAFNVARAVYDGLDKLTVVDGGEALIRAIGVVSLSPLRNVVAEGLAGRSTPAGMLDVSRVTNLAERREEWSETTTEDIRNALTEIRFDSRQDAPFVRFDVADRAVLVNARHPFAAEYARSKAEKEVVRAVALVTLLSDMYALDAGVDPRVLEAVRTYRDRLMRYRAWERRKSGAYIAEVLLETQRTEHSTDFEDAVSTALSYLGFDVEDLAKPGEPEGLARAFAEPTGMEPAPIDATPIYTVSFDAKSTRGGRAAKTANVNSGGIHRHKKKFEADYSLVVAPDYERGALEEECGQQGITPMRAGSLARLLELTVKHGAISLRELQGLFGLRTPDAVNAWIDKLAGRLETARPITIAVFLRALEDIRGTTGETLAPQTVQREIGRVQRIPVKVEHVVSFVRGLSVVVPDLIGVDDDRIVVNASPEKLADAIAVQLEAFEAKQD